MAVTNNATLIEDMEGAGPSLTSIGGGQGAGLNTDIYIAGSQSVARRSSNVTTHGFFMNPGAATNLSGGGWWVKFFIWITHYTQLTAAEVRIGSSTTAYETHALTVSEYPALGGWWPVWVQVDAGTDTGSPDFSVADEFGQAISIASVGGNAPNNISDQIHASQRPVMTWDGSTGSFASFSTTNDSVALGTLRRKDGVYNLYANLKIGSATATVFTSSGAVILAPDFSHLGSGTSWLGIDLDLQNASTVITWTDGVYGSTDPAGASNKPDLIVTGTSGSADLSRQRFQGLRAVTLTSGVTASGTTFDTCGTITAAGANLAGSSFSNSTAASAVVWDVNEDISTKLANTSFSSSGTGHGLELGTNSPTTVNLPGATFDGYAGSNGSTGNEAVWVRRTSGTVTINITGGDTPTIRTDGATVVVNNTVTLTFTGIPEGLEARVRKGAVSLAHNASVTGGSFAYSYNYTAGEVVTATFGGLDTGGNAYERLTLSITLSNSNQTIPLEFELDPSYVSS